MQYAKIIPYFRGVFMRDSLPRIPREKECGIVNLDNSTNNGTHWVAYAKIKDKIEYFDSYGNLRPPKELLKYLGLKIQYNYIDYQKNHPFNCGHLCIQFLDNFWLINSKHL